MTICSIQLKLNHFNNINRLSSDKSRKFVELQLFKKFKTHIRVVAINNGPEESMKPIFLCLFTIRIDLLIEAKIKNNLVGWLSVLVCRSHDSRVTVEYTLREMTH